MSRIALNAKADVNSAVAQMTDIHIIELKAEVGIDRFVLKHII